MSITIGLACQQIAGLPRISALKLSNNAQFRDPAGACKLIETAVFSGDQAMAQRLAGCRGS
ncbi:hypothetical protein [Bradyrhizobium sp.]|uniref:hypothetical protein n=1 Tax=Bradyrhizobium sp. TaxID=376 RepID=UPI001E0FF7C7|nr:hypothetical protein [Bradyrhizobium sp.]MBI5320631.1 hypothetical protein [Bradyrhizobium sp.]